MDSESLSRSGKTSLSSGKTSLSSFALYIRQHLYWIFGIIIISMFLITGLVCGLVFGLRANAAPHHHHSQASASTVNLTADLGYSSYKGASVATGVAQWLGIRYAAAPVGNLRFRAPQDPPTDGKLYQATTVSYITSSQAKLTSFSTGPFAIQVLPQAWIHHIQRTVSSLMSMRQRMFPLLIRSLFTFKVVDSMDYQLLISTAPA